MPIKEEAKCRCKEPKPVGPFVMGAQKCETCGKVANWKELE